MIIQIDDREGKRIEYAKKQYKKHDIELKHLKTADFIFNQKVAFEYKTIPDFITSVQSGRMTEQAIRLNKEFEHPFIMIEGEDVDLGKELDKRYFLQKTRKKNKPQTFSRKQFYGAIDSLNDYVTVMQRPTMYWCFYSMLNKAQKSLDGAPVNRKVVKTGNTAYNFLRYCVGGVGKKTAEKLVNECGLKSIEDVLNVSIEELSGVKGISLNKAEVIYRNIHN